VQAPEISRRFVALSATKGQGEKLGFRTDESVTRLLTGLMTSSVSLVSKAACSLVTDLVGATPVRLSGNMIAQIVSSMDALPNSQQDNIIQVGGQMRVGDPTEVNRISLLKLAFYQNGKDKRSATAILRRLSVSFDALPDMIADSADHLRVWHEKLAKKTLGLLPLLSPRRIVAMLTQFAEATAKDNPEQSHRVTSLILKHGFLEQIRPVIMSEIIASFPELPTYRPVRAAFAAFLGDTEMLDPLLNSQDETSLRIFLRALRYMLKQGDERSFWPSDEWIVKLFGLSAIASITVFVGKCVCCLPAASNRAGRSVFNIIVTNLHRFPRSIQRNILDALAKESQDRIFENDEFEEVWRIALAAVKAQSSWNSTTGDKLLERMRDFFGSKIADSASKAISSITEDVSHSVAIIKMWRFLPEEGMLYLVQRLIQLASVPLIGRKIMKEFQKCYPTKVEWECVENLIQQLQASQTLSAACNLFLPFLAASAGDMILLTEILSSANDPNVILACVQSLQFGKEAPLPTRCLETILDLSKARDQKLAKAANACLHDIDMSGDSTSATAILQSAIYASSLSNTLEYCTPGREHGYSRVRANIQETTQDISTGGSGPTDHPNQTIVLLLPRYFQNASEKVIGSLSFLSISR
jgi:hypothetical protein